LQKQGRRGSKVGRQARPVGRSIDVPYLTANIFVAAIKGTIQIKCLWIDTTPPNKQGCELMFSFNNIHHKHWHQRQPVHFGE